MACIPAREEFKYWGSSVVRPLQPQSGLGSASGKSGTWKERLQMTRSLALVLLATCTRAM